MDEERKEGSERSPTERAEELLDRAGQTAGFFAASLGWRATRLASRAREEAEDIWAEARNVRHEMRGAGSGEGGPEGPPEATDAVRRTAEEVGVDLGKVRGTGTDGGITEDVSREAGAGS